MKYFFLISILFFSLFLQTTFFSIPLVLISMLLFGVFFKEQWIFLVAFVMGILVDIMKFQQVGMSSIFLVVMLEVVFLYQRKYEIYSIPFIFFYTSIASFVYLIFSGTSFPILEALMSGVIAGILFFLLSRINVKPSMKRSRNGLHANY